MAETQDDEWRHFAGFDEIFDEELALALKERGRGRLDDAIELCGRDGSAVSRDVIRAVNELKANDDARGGRREREDLVALSLSGGGIRSATFSLGVLQGLDRVGLFDCIDYLSTVSGGGYLGSCVSSVYATLTRRSDFPFQHKGGEREPQLFRHLRNNANYLAAGGLLDYLRLPALLLRGILLNFVALLPYVLALAIATYLFVIGPGKSDHPILWGFPATIVLGSLMALAILLFPLSHLFAQDFERLRNWRARDRASKLLGALLLAVVVAFVMELQPFVVKGVRDWWQAGASWSWLKGLGVAVSGLAPFLGVVGALSHRLPNTGSATIYLLAALGFVCTWAFYVALSVSMTLCDGLAPTLAVVGLISFGYSALAFDLNYTSLHRFYRDRLSKAYLVRTTDGQVARDEATDRQLLSTLSDHGPYHLINTAINVDDPGEEYRRGRAAESFLFSRGFVGSAVTGYVRSAAMEATSRQVNLGTAMAISGAAVAPAAGKATSKPLRFLMALLDIRLNYWLPNPRHVRKPWFRFGPRLRQRAGVWHLVAEMFGGLSGDGKKAAGFTTDSVVNLSDGGHFENLGLYELIRRRCRLIIASDAECDPKFEFAGLADAIRMVLIDFGTTIVIDGLDEIRRGERHHAVGTIYYSDGLEGRLIYLKASVRGDAALQSALPEPVYLTSPYRTDNLGYDQNAYIANYRASHPEFPHESTADQFFDEVQFECYRALGYEVAIAALRA